MHCGQDSKECFDAFFGPYCILAGVQSIKVDEYIPSSMTVAALYCDAYQNTVHFYCFLVTRYFDQGSISELCPPHCMIKGSFAYLLDLHSKAVDIEYSRNEVKENVVRSVILFGKDHHLQRGAIADV